MNEWELLFGLGIITVGLRTTSWWLQSWQLREYRWDRMLEYFRTHDGRKNLLNLWAFSGLLPRPQISGRLIVIGIILITLSIGIIVGLHEVFVNIENWQWGWNWIKALIVWERMLWLIVPVAIKISAIPVWLRKKSIFREAGEIVAEGKNVTRIGITGSYGKSSTKKILVHLLREKYGTDAVLTNPGNENNELAIARLIKRNERFFIDPTTGPKQKFFVCEVGAYKKGEIAQVCEFTHPQIGILTGLNAQHVGLFGNAEKLRSAKFELAESCSKTIFFNADTPALVEIFEDRKITAIPVGIKKTVAKNISSDFSQTKFYAYGQDFVLPWAGEFFISNALLALEAARESGCTTEELSSFLNELPPLERALHSKVLANGATLLLDPYSANPDGVLGAIEHLGKFEGKKIFIGIPLRELGKDSEKIHREVFEKLKEINAEVFWFRHDYEKIAKEILGEKFHGDDIKILKKIKKELKTNDAVLLESRLPKTIEKLF
jgi:UDP-N-acetylmuramoyl-tripeptide--D-alanyl-D-alanine ligase